MKPFVPQKLPISDVVWEPLIPLIAKANRSLAYYDGVLQGVANPELLLSPMTTQEAVLSSRIEGTQATLGDVLKFAAGEEPRQAERREDIFEIRNYQRALKAGEEELKHRPFSLNLLKKLHEILLSTGRGRNLSRGRFRTIQNWIGSSRLQLKVLTLFRRLPEQSPKLYIIGKPIITCSARTRLCNWQ
jgi:Fic family protein